MTAGEILNNKNYLAISYGGYRHNSREVQPTITEIKEDLKILSSIGYKILRTYNVHFAEAKNLLQAIQISVMCAGAKRRERENENEEPYSTACSP